MPKKLIILSFFLMLVSVVNAQQKLSNTIVDQQSYQLYLDEKWEELIQLSKKAEQQNIDFFYLQFRTGIAYYHLGKYRKANPYFIAAYSQEPSNVWLQEYLYFSLSFSARKLEANKHATSFSEAVKKKIGFPESGIDYLNFETSYGFNQDFEELKNRNFSGEIDLGEDYGEGYFLKNYSYQSFDLSHRIGAVFKLNHNLTYYGVNRETIVNWGEQTSAPIKTNQFNYFINPELLIRKKLYISPSFTVIWGTSDVYAGQLINNFTEKVFDITQVTYSDMVFSTAIWSDFVDFSPGMEFNIGNINDADFTQLSAWVAYYPFSNAKLYFTPRIYFKSGAEGFAFNTFGMSAGATIGKVHISAQYLIGEMENFVESAGYSIFNLPGVSHRKIMGSIYFPIHQKYRFVLRYINRSVTEKYQVYTLGERTKTIEYNYLIHTITAGISWKF